MTLPYLKAPIVKNETIFIQKFNQSNFGFFEINIKSELSNYSQNITWVRVYVESYNCRDI